MKYLFSRALIQLAPRGVTRALLQRDTKPPTTCADDVKTFIKLLKVLFNDSVTNRQ
jgi:hypothetical protein